jgi:hypothetical protein
MCDWRNADNREGAHCVVAVRLGRGKGNIPYLFLCIGEDIEINTTYVLLLL